MDAALIVGCGYVGGALATMLLRDGISPVYGLRRRIEALPAGVKAVAADLSRPLDLRFLSSVAATSQVVFAASAGAHTEEAYKKTYVEGVKNLLVALRQLPTLPQRLLFVSSTSVYGDAAGSRVNETTPAVPDAFPGRVMLEAEALIRESGIEAVILRFGGIYGPERWRLAEQVRSGEAVLLPDGGPVSNRIHRDDGAAAILHVMKLKNPESIYMIVDDEPTPHNDILTWLATRSGRQLAAGAATPSITSRQLRGNKSCSNARLKAAGFRCRYPSFREGFAAYFESLEAPAAKA